MGPEPKCQRSRGARPFAAASTAPEAASLRSLRLPADTRLMSPLALWRLEWFSRYYSACFRGGQALQRAQP
eukprot:9093032-Pyramimonas_sp.AAC.1